MSHYKHLFFDMDKTVTPARQPLLPEMAALLSSLSEEVIIVSGGERQRIASQLGSLRRFTLAQNGSHGFDCADNELWYDPLEDHHRNEIMEHIEKLIAALDHEIGHDYLPIEDRGAQITFSPVGNNAPHEIKSMYDPEAKLRLDLLSRIPLESDEVVVKIGGSTSFDYIHKTRHKGTGVTRLIDLQGWNRDDCVYFGDGLFPGGNDESVIGVIETIPVVDHLDTYERLRAMFK
ncbi:HAD-IIB family hydrolase [Patescibacteria group bacterium]|nr:HAD-IIB family hydrolase [Patescibacteria group bacterium]